MANSPPLLKAYLHLNELLAETSLSAVEQQVVLLVSSAANECDYCVSAHAMTARLSKVPDGVIESIRSGQPIADSRLESLRGMTEAIVTTRGWPDPSVIQRFLGAGYRPEQVLEVILIVGTKTLSNYTNHVANTPLDPQFSTGAGSDEPPSAP